MSAGLKLLRHHRVHGDHHLLLPGHLQVPILHLVDDPVLEGLANHGCTNIDDPLLTEFLELSCNRHVLLETLVVADLVQDILDRKALILRNC